MTKVIALHEFDLMTKVLKAVPQKYQKGFHWYDITWTCVDVSNEWIAIGTNIGKLYLYDRINEKLQHRLSSKVSNS